jgi:diguanylate cyclase (GGDEF)-like protein/PAS domain S-box-containing protein
MNAANVPFRLLIINDSQDEAQRLISMFQNAGKPCRAQHINSEEGFNKVIEEQVWDLVIAHCDTQSLTPTQAIRTIRKYNHDLPMILVTDDETGRAIVEGMKMGACDVVKLDDDQHLLLVVSRELNNRLHRKNTRLAERKVREMERRNRQLLDSSKDGIAYVQDGMFIYANDSFAEMWGYQSREDIEYIPLMDIIDTEDQDQVKSKLKSFALQNDEDINNRLTFNVKTPADEHQRVDVELNLGQFEDESCIQFNMQAKFADSEMLEAELESYKNTDGVTGLANKVQLNERLCEAVNQHSDTEINNAFMFIDIDQFKDKVESLVGIDGANEVLATVAGFLQSHTNNDDFLARTGDHSFAIITSDNNLEKLLNAGNIFCKTIREHLFEVNNKTLRLTISIGITIINETTIDAQTAINQATSAIEYLRNRKQGVAGDGVNIFQPSEGEQVVLVGALQKAIQENRFRLLFQPVISLRGDETERYEVLLRMIDEEGEEISPTYFLQTAESMKVVTKIDRWVILEAIKHISNLDQKNSSAQLMVNISHHSLCDESMLPWLKVAFNAAKVDPSCLVFQAKETEIEQHLTAATKFIEEAASMGVSFCINNFGCALDPIALVENLDVEFIKVDGSFSLEIQDNPSKTDALEKLLKTIHAKNKISIIPLVENASILSRLWKLGIHCIQGHYLQPPSPAMDYEFAVESTG